jgi:hypothetical protein
MRLRCLMTTEDLARWGLWGIPSAWRSPTTRRPGGSPRRDRQWPRVALPPGRRVVALGGGRRDAPPYPHLPSLAHADGRSSRRSARPARVCFGWAVRPCVGECRCVPLRCDYVLVRIDPCGLVVPLSLTTRCR